MILSFPMASGTHGRWSVYSTVLSLKDLVTLCTMNIAEPEGKVWKDAFYTGGPAGQAMNRSVTPSRTSALVEYVNERLLTPGAAPGALPAISLGAIGGSASFSVTGSTPQLNLNCVDKVVVIDGLGRYSALLEIFMKAKQEGNSVSLDVPVTIYFLNSYADLDELKSGCRQILHDFNYHGTKMRAATSGQFDSADVITPVSRLLHSKLTQNGVRVSYGTLKGACSLLGCNDPVLYSATRKVKDKSGFDPVAFGAIASSPSAVTHKLAVCMTTTSTKAQTRLLAPIVQTVLHTVGQHPVLLNREHKVAAAVESWFTGTPDLNRSWRNKSEFNIHIADFKRKLRAQGFSV